VLDLRAADGSHLRLAALPFVSQRFVVRAAELMDQDGAQHAGSYAERCRMVLRHLCAGFGPETVNVVVAHAMVRGGRLGGGEREAQTIEDYWIDATAFPPTAQYVALGHLHRTQQLPGPAPLWYSGSPIQVDFGEQDDDKHVLLVEVHPGRPARVEPVRLDGVRRLRTVDGTVAELRRLADEVGNDLLRVVVTEARRAGLADEVRAVLPNALEIRLAAPVDGPFGARPTRQGRTPHELFSSYLQERRIEDPRVERLFAELLDDQVRDGP
jgi:exonuclease SbcD